MNWIDNKDLRAFFEKVESFNLSYDSIETADGIQKLYLSFWSIAEIEESETIKAEWDIAHQLVPFYGDWHDVMCVDIGSSPASVVYLDDDRRIIHRWPDIDNFLSSLRVISEDEPRNDSGIIKEKSWLDF